MESKNPQSGPVLLDSKVKRAINNKPVSAAPVLSKVVESPVVVVAPAQEPLSNPPVIRAEVESSVGGSVGGDAAKNVGAQTSDDSVLNVNLGGSEAASSMHFAEK